MVEVGPARSQTRPTTLTARSSRVREFGLVGVDPNDAMESHATANLAKARTSGSKLDANPRSCMAWRRRYRCLRKRGRGYALRLCAALSIRSGRWRRFDECSNPARRSCSSSVLSEDDPDLTAAVAV